MSNRSGSLVIPEWQDDAEVTACPICKRQFHFLFRKHHCRRCGRIICNDCSPHRITLPRQYIVRPPHEPPPYRLATEDVDGEPEASNPALGGGETVRVCNPCVPDPNYGPPPQQTESAPLDVSRAQLPPPGVDQRDNAERQSPFTSPQRSPERSYPDRYRTIGNVGSASQRSEGARVYYSRRSNSQSGPVPAHQILDARWRRRANRTSSDVEASLPPPITEVSSGSRPIPGVALAASPSRARSAPFGSAPPNLARAGSQSGPRLIPMRTPQSHEVAPWESRAPARRPRQQVREEDECPVCGSQDPPFGPEGDQTLRERHIESCINEHLQFSSTPRSNARPPQPPAGPERTATDPTSSSSIQIPRSNETETPASSAVAALGSTPTHHAIAPSAPTPGPSTSTPTPASGSMTAAGRPRANTHHQRMLVYHATEKDCFDATGTVQECVICFEDFNPGDEMGRLECLCKFHRGCIKGWWESGGEGRRRWGSCPTHTLVI